VLSRRQAGSLRCVAAALGRQTIRCCWPATAIPAQSARWYRQIRGQFRGRSSARDALLQANSETPEQIATHPHPFYTPIATFGSDYLLEPVAYGLKFAGSFSDGILLKTEFSTKLQAAGVNATAYAAKMPSVRPR